MARSHAPVTRPIVQTGESVNLGNCAARNKRAGPPIPEPGCAAARAPDATRCADGGCTSIADGRRNSGRLRSGIPYGSLRGDFGAPLWPGSDEPCARRLRSRRRGSEYYSYTGARRPICVVHALVRRQRNTGSPAYHATALHPAAGRLARTASGRPSRIVDLGSDYGRAIALSRSVIRMPDWPHPQAWRNSRRRHPRGCPLRYLHWPSSKRQAKSWTGF